MALAQLSIAKLLTLSFHALTVSNMADKLSTSRLLLSKNRVKQFTGKEAIYEILNSSDESNYFFDCFDDSSLVDTEDFVESDEELNDTNFPIIAAPCYKQSLLMNDIRCFNFICYFILYTMFSICMQFLPLYVMY